MIAMFQIGVNDSHLTRKGVVRMKKISILCMFMLLVGCHESPKIKLGSYEKILSDGNVNQQIQLKLYEENGKSLFIFSPAMISSTIYSGTFEIEGDQLILNDLSQSVKIYFTLSNDELIFNKEKSDEIAYNEFLEENPTLNLIGEK